MDDNATNREILGAFLELWGCRYQTASNASEALSHVYRAQKAGRPFGLVIVDQMMPRMDGETFGKAVKADPLLKTTKLIMLTSMGIRRDSARIKNIGFDAFLFKPVRRAHLFNCLLKIFGTEETQPAPDTSKDLMTCLTTTERQKKKQKILVAEDNPINQKVVMCLLDSFGYPADVVGNGKEALAAVAEHVYDLVLMDVQMPEMDGLHATRLIRKGEIETHRHLPIIAMTAGAMTGDREKCLNAGMDAYIAKPVEPKRLLEAIERFFTDDHHNQSTVESAPKNISTTSQFDLPIVNRNEAVKRVLGNEKLLDELLQTFADGLSGQIQTLQSALNKKNADVLASQAHQLKGAAANLSAEQIRMCAYDFEMIAESGRLEEGQAVLELLSKAADRFFRHIRIKKG